MNDQNNFIPFLQPILKQSTQQVDPSILWQSDKPIGVNSQVFPFGFRKTGDKEIYYLPYEPMIDIIGGNTIIRRNIFKASSGLVGSVKERWNQKDYEITIRGFLIGEIMKGSVEQCYPIKDFNKLKEYLTSGESIEVFCPPLEMLSINRIIISDFSYPFTKGENVQAYEIKAYSDFSYNLLIDIID
jgi:hypothetical protein